MKRRLFLKKISLTSLSFIGFNAFYNACKESDPCNDLTGLTEADKQLRIEFKYIGKTPYPEKRCDNCLFWTAPPEGEKCGGCQLMSGPFNPAGYCDQWAEMES
jgi:hypothetical protein